MPVVRRPFGITHVSLQRHWLAVGIIDHVQLVRFTLFMLNSGKHNEPVEGPGKDFCSLNLPEVQIGDAGPAHQQHFDVHLQKETGDGAIAVKSTIASMQLAGMS